MLVLTWNVHWRACACLHCTAPHRTAPHHGVTATAGVSIVPENGAEIARLGEMIKIATREQHPVQHPVIDYPGCDIVALCGKCVHAGVVLVGSGVRAVAVG